jgi:hypothetical protein
MKPVTVRHHYPQPRDVVWAELSTISRHVLWMLDAESLTFHTEAQRGEGVRFACRTRIGPIVVTDEMVITEWREREEIAVQHRGIVTGEGSFTLHDHPEGGTDVIWSEQLHFPWFIGGKVGAFIGRKVFYQIWKLNLRKLAHMLSGS